MNTGTLTLTQNSASVVGNGTKFNTELNVGDFIFTTINGINYTLGIDKITSDTDLTLTLLFGGTTIKNQSFATIPRQAMVGITSQLAADTARAIRALNFDKANWQQVLSVAGDITITLPDGSKYSGPSWQKIIELLKELDIESIKKIFTQVHADAAQAETSSKNSNSAAQQAKASSQSALESSNNAASKADNAAKSAIDAANSSSSAAQARGDAQRAKEAAEKAAGTIDTSQLLKKGSNLSDVADFSTTRNNLDVYSKKEAASKQDVVNLGNRLGYALIDLGTITKNNRYAVDNPFGNDTPVITRVEVQSDGRWGSTGWAFSNSSGGYGAQGGYSEGEGIVIQTGIGSLFPTPHDGGGTITSKASSAPCRIHVWKVTN